MQLKIRENLRTANLNQNFTASYKKRVNALMSRGYQKAIGLDKAH